MDEAERELRKFLDEGKPEKKAGRPPVPLPATFEDAVKALKPRESEFVRHVLAGANYADAYRMTSSTAVTLRTAQVNGSRLATHDGVKHALKLGREASAVQALTGIKYDVQAAQPQRKRLGYSHVAEEDPVRIDQELRLDFAPQEVSEVQASRGAVTTNVFDDLNRKKQVIGDNPADPAVRDVPSPAHDRPGPADRERVGRGLGPDVRGRRRDRDRHDQLRCRVRTRLPRR